MSHSFTKLLGKSTCLQAVLDKQKTLQECMVKTNPCRINVSSALLKWSMAESNLSLFDAFSSWSDLDHALLQLTQTVIDQNFTFRQTFKNIQGEERRLAELQKETDAASKKVKQICAKLEAARKAKKLDQVKIDHLESELTLSKGKEREMLNMLETKDNEFEICKGKWLKEILCLVSKSYVDCLEQSLKVWKVKHEIATAMADEPLYQGEKLKTDSHIKVSGMFTQLGFELPHREEVAKMKNRILPGKPPESTSSSKTLGNNSNSLTNTNLSDGYEWKVDASGCASDGEDYAFPDQFPDSYGEDYLIPGAANDNLSHPIPPTLPADDTGDSDGSIEEKGASISRGIKVLPSGGTMKGPNPLILPNVQQEHIPPKKIYRRSTRPPSSPPPKDNTSPKPLPRGEQDKPSFNKKPAVLPKPGKPGTITKHKYSPILSSKGSIENVDQDEHEYSEVPNEDKTGMRYPAPRRNSSSTILNNNIKQVIETDSESEDYENIAIGAIS